MNPKSSPIGLTINRFAGRRHPLWISGRCYGQAVKAWHPSAAEIRNQRSCPMSHRNDQSKKSFTAFDQASTLVSVVELSCNFWLVAGVVPGIERHPLKK